MLYVTLGTVFSSDAVLSNVLAAISDLDVRVIVTVGPRGDPSLLGAQPSNVHVARYIAQQDLLPHCDGVISHAGSGTFLAALAAGLPQVCLPQAADQFLNAAAAEAAGFGVAVRPADSRPTPCEQRCSESSRTERRARRPAALPKRSGRCQPQPTSVTTSPPSSDSGRLTRARLARRASVRMRVDVPGSAISAWRTRRTLS